MKLILILFIFFCACRVPSIYRFDQRHYDIEKVDSGYVLLWVEDPKNSDSYTHILWIYPNDKELHLAPANEITIFKTEEEAEKAAHQHWKQIVQSWKDNKYGK